MMTIRLLIVVPLFAAAAATVAHAAEPKLITVHESFDADPGWIGFNNRQVGTEMPVVRQNFGWSETSHTGCKGEIGGVVHD